MCVNWRFDFNYDVWKSRLVTDVCNIDGEGGFKIFKHYKALIKYLSCVWIPESVRNHIISLISIVNWFFLDHNGVIIPIVDNTIE